MGLGVEVMKLIVDVILRSYFFHPHIYTIFALMRIEVYTDGACSGNPGKGGYGIVMQIPEKSYRKEFSEGYRLTTNNRMELWAVVVAFQKLKSPQEDVHIFTDSKYVSDAIHKNWIEKWNARGYKNVKNSDLWRNFLKYSAPHSYTVHWVKGHSGNELNERADQLAVAATQKKKLKVDKNFEAIQK